MAYTITTTAGTTLATIADGTVNTSTTSLTLIGKNYAGYGVFLNENYIKLLENFSNSTAPSAALTGQLWYDKGQSVLKVYDGTTWKPISSSASSNTAPTTAVTGDLWWDTANAQLKVFPGSLPWVTIGPAYTSTAGTSGAVVESILDSTGSPRVVVKFYISNSVIAVLSSTSFTPQTAIAGFTTIKPGFNLISASTLTGSQFTGDASNALLLNSLDSTKFLRSDINTSTAYSLGVGGTLTVGSDLTLNVANSAVKITGTNSSNSMDFYINKSGVSTKAIGISTAGAIGLNGATTVTGTFGVTSTATFDAAVQLKNTTTVYNTVLPNANNTINIGASGTKFNTIYATTFNGTSVQAQYADLAERFEADVPMVPGTVVEIGGIKEITAAVQELSENVFGVISTLPGFLLNGAAGSDKTHPAIAVNGRVPVRVIGQVKKGDRLVSAGRGLARAATRSEMTAFNVIGRALENKTTTGEGTVEAIVKLNS